jgi:hypothetical protein
MNIKRSLSSLRLILGLTLIGIKPLKGGHRYSADDFQLMADIVDRVASIVALVEIQVRDRNPRADLQSESDKLITSLVTDPDPKFLKMVEDGLRKLSDIIALGQSPLADVLKVNGKTHIENGKALRQELVKAIEALRPSGARPEEPLPREWESYVVLHDAYVKRVANREIMARLYTSEGTFNRIRRKALRGVSKYLLEKQFVG